MNIPSRAALAVLLLFTFFLISTPAQTNRRRATAPQPAQSTETIPVTVMLRDGQTIKGKFLDANSKTVSILVGSSRQQLNMADVASLTFSESISTQKAGVKQAADDAIRALRRLESATSVGVSFVEYGTRLIDAKAEVDNALGQLPESALKAELTLAMAEYTLASKIWQLINDEMRRDRYNTGYLDASSEVGVMLVEKYKLEPNVLPASKRSILFKADVLSAVWSKAREHIDKAAALQ